MFATDDNQQEAGDFPASPVAAALPLVCNVADDVLYRNIAATIARGHPIITAVPPHDGVVLLVGGGPSAEDDLAEIAALQKGGAHIFALNGAGLWLQGHAIVPDALIVLDARAHNVRFVAGIDQSTVLYLASQCDVSVFAAAREHTIVAWHPPMGGQSGAVEHRDTVLIGGGTSVGIRALRLVHVLGFRTAHLFGYDSSFRDGDAHAYDQFENAADQPRECGVGNRTFISTAWMIRQADDFQFIAAGLMAEGLSFHVHGDGLLPALASAMTVPQ